MDFDNPFDGMGGLRRRPDPGSFDARFPGLADDRSSAVDATRRDARSAMQQHMLAQAGGRNSAAAMFDPMKAGSVFSRQYPGLYDAFRDQQRRVDATPPQEASVGIQPRPTEPSAIDRYAQGMGYGAGGTYNARGAGTYSADQAAHSGSNSTIYDPSAPGAMRKRRTDLASFEVM